MSMPNKLQETSSRPYERKFLERPFPKLVAHFMANILKSGSETGASELEISVGGMLALLAVPGAFISIMLFDKYSSLQQFFGRRTAFDIYTASLPDKYFFIVFSMAITGIVTIVKWDRILPGRQDFINLTPLPVSLWRIFAANLTAILIAAMLFAVDVNAISTILFPLIVSANGISAVDSVRFIGVHAAVVLLASAFMFFACFSVTGVLMTLLQPRAYRRISPYVRMAGITAMVAMLGTSFVVPQLMRNLPSDPDSLLRWFPPVWFLSLYQSMQSRGGSELAAMGKRGVLAIAIAFPVSIVFCALSYRRHFMRIQEQSPSAMMDVHKGAQFLSRLLDRIYLRTPFEQAGFAFAVRTLLRSERHSLLAGGFFGLGIVIGSQIAIAHIPAHEVDARLLSIPLVLVYCLVCGLRFAIEIPSAMSASWLFRQVVDNGRYPTVSLARKLLMAFVFPLVIIPCLPIYWYFFGWKIAFFHSLFVFAAALFMVCTLTDGYRKIPFTCSIPSVQNNGLVLAIVYLTGFFVFTAGGAAFDLALLRKPESFVLIPVVWIAVRSLLLRVHKDFSTEEDTLIFAEQKSDAVQLLDLASRHDHS